MHDAEDEDPSAAIQHWLQEREEGSASIPIQEAGKGKNKKPLKASSKAIIEFARACTCMETYPTNILIF